MENPVLDYLAKNPTVVYSTSTISKRIGMKRYRVQYFANNSDNIRSVEPIEVGSGCYNLSLYKYKA